MAQSTPNVADCIPAGLRLLEHRPIKGGSGSEEACAPLSGPQAKISRLWDFADFDNVAQAVPLNVVGPTPNRGGDQGEAAEGALSADARTGPTGVIEVEPSGYLRPADDLTETDMGNLNAVLDHEIARNTMKNYRVQWNNFIMWAVGRGIRVLPADPGQVAAYLAERIEEHGHKPATLRAAAAALAFDQRQLLLPVDDNYSCRSWEVTIWYRRYRIGHRSAGNGTEAEANGRQGTTSGGGGIWYERADGADVAARQAAVGEEGQAEVANPTGPVRRDWAKEVEPLLRSDVEGALKATTILEWLDERHPGRFSVSQLRTLQRRLARLACAEWAGSGRCTSSRLIPLVARRRWTSHTAASWV